MTHSLMDEPIGEYQDKNGKDVVEPPTITYTIIAKVDNDTAFYEEFETSADVQEALDRIDEAVEDQLNFNEAWNNSNLAARFK